MNEIPTTFNVFKAIATAIMTAATFLFGSTNGLLWTVIVLIVLDYITGVISAIYNHKLSSEVGYKGICKKITMILIIAVANIIDVNVIGSEGVLRTVVETMFIANESISLLENAASMGITVPKKLMSYIKGMLANEQEDSTVSTVITDKPSNVTTDTTNMKDGE